MSEMTAEAPVRVCCRNCSRRSYLGLYPSRTFWSKSMYEKANCRFDNRPVGHHCDEHEYSSDKEKEYQEWHSNNIERHGYLYVH